jgi:hypothetical protein
MRPRALRQIVQEPRSGRPKQVWTDGHAKDGSWAPAPLWFGRKRRERLRKQKLEGSVQIVGWGLGRRQAQ